MGSQRIRHELTTKQQQRKGFLCDSTGKDSACNAGDLGSTPGTGRSPGEGKGYPVQYFGLENSTDRMVHGVPKSWTRLTFTFSSNKQAG